MKHEKLTEFEKMFGKGSLKAWREINVCAKAIKNGIAGIEDGRVKAYASKVEEFKDLKSNVLANGLNTERG